MQPVANCAEIVEKDAAGKITVEELLKILVNEYGNRISKLQGTIAERRYYEAIATATHPKELIDENIFLKKHIEKIEEENRCKKTMNFLK